MAKDILKNIFLTKTLSTEIENSREGRIFSGINKFLLRDSDPSNIYSLFIT